MSDTAIHIIVKWRAAEIFHTLAPDTIQEHCLILRNCESSNRYVWWGKISLSGYLGMDNNDALLVNEQIRENIPTYIFLYCPDKSQPTMHVGKLLEVTDSSMLYDTHTPTYYRDMVSIEGYNIPFWFKISDITEIPFSETLSNLMYPNFKVFDPVSVNFYPQKVLMHNPIKYFEYNCLFEHILEGNMIRCFKTGGYCSRADEINYDPKQVFIGCPFQKTFLNLVNYSIKPACENLGYRTWIANEQFRNIDIMCKVCGGIQSSSIAVIDITNWNANVLFELGLLYGLGKNVLIIKQDTEDVPVDLKGIEYILYDKDSFEETKSIVEKYVKQITTS